MTDLLISLNQFGEAIVEALNDADVIVSDADTFGSLILVVARDDTEAHLAGSINYDVDKKKWHLDYQAIESIRIGNA